MTEINLTNTRTRKKEPFVPLDPTNVRMYVCGPTVYDRAHLGNARPVVVFDVLFRLLRHVYGPDHVTYVRNFTDVDDKINAKAAETGRPIREITDETIHWYHQDMDALGALRPSIKGNVTPEAEPRATEWIGAMIGMIAGLINKGHAYAAEGHVLFDVRSYADYGKLSGRSLDDMIAGARVEVAPFKRDPMDFVLWKPSTGDQPGWDSPWGYGRPGWHIECSAMAHELLGETFDIHAGGIDLQFPHHENEIAQSRCAHPEGQFARYWLHNEMLQVEGKKMSKSLGNFFTVRDLLDQGVPGEVIRFVMLSTHYSKPMDWRRRSVTAAKGTLRKWKTATEEVRSGGEIDPRVVEALADDLNLPLAVAALHDLYRSSRYHSLKASAEFLGLLDEASGNWHSPSFDHGTRIFIEAVFGARLSKRVEKDFEASDFLRAVLEVSGVVVADGKEPAWKASFAGQERGWKKLYELSENATKWPDYHTLDTLSRPRKVEVVSEVDEESNVLDNWLVSIASVPDTIDKELLGLARYAVPIK